MKTQKKILTADELLRLPDDGQRHELVRGELRTMSPAGGGHGFIAGRMFSVVFNHVDAHDLGFVFAAETGFTIGRSPDTVRAPDVAFVARGRFPGGRPPVTFPDLAPDLVVEVVSPWDRAGEIREKVQDWIEAGVRDRAGEIREKVQDWIEAGVRAVVVVYPATETVRVHRPSRQVEVLTLSDILDLEDVLPGFHCPVGEIFKV